jgi:secreted trypsin-like serine protease
MYTFIPLCLILPALAAALSQRAGPDMRVVGGSNANIANHPWQASLRINDNHACGAVLISATRALTAAHCGGGATNTYSILAGTSERTVTTCATCALRKPVTAFYRHPGFINNPSAGYPSDLATVWFYSIAINTNIAYADMARPSDGEFVNVNCVVSGWGRQAGQGSGSELPTTLQSATMTTISNTQCISVWGSNRIRPEQICAQTPGVSVCGGDQGGPLVCNGKLAGVYSWGEANCGPDFPAVFVRVSAYYDWIIENGTMTLPVGHTFDMDDSAYSVEDLMGSLFD